MDENTNIGSADIENSRYKRTKKRDKKRKITSILKVVLTIIIIGAAAFFGFKAYKEIIKNKNSSGNVIPYTAYAQSKSSCFKDFLVTTTVDGITMINKSGEYVLDDVSSSVSPYVKGMNEPVFATNDKIMLVYDVKGRTAVLFSDNGIIKTYNFTTDIIKAKMSKTGQFVFITKADGMKASVKVYNSDGNELMSWFSGTGYVVDAQISDTKSVMAVLINEVENSKLSSKILFFTFDNPEPFMGKVLGETIANYVSYYDETAYIVCEDCLIFIDSEGNMETVKEFKKNTPKFFKSLKNGTLVFCYSEDDERYNVSVYGKKGKEISNFMMDSFLSVSDVSDKEFLVLKRKGVLSVNYKGKITRDLDCAFDVKNASYYDDKIAVLSTDSIFIY